VFNIFKRKLQMKKSLVFAAMLAIALAACGKKEEAKPAEAPAAPAAEAPAAAPAAPAAEAPAADAKK
jgi:predicted small lipoprotein YifL